MKKLVLTISLLCAFVQYAFAGGLTTYHQARVLFSQGEFLQAKRIFASCLEDPELVAVKNTISNWINDCDLAMQEQNRNAQIAAENRKKKNSERKNNQYVNISVNAKESSELYNSTISVMSEVIRQNERRICPNIDDALTVVTVSLDIKHEEITNGFYKVKGSGTVLLGSAISVNDFAGQWTVDCEATSAVDADDAERLLLNKLNHKLAHALDNLLNGKPQESGYYIPAQTIAVYIDNEINLSSLRGFINGYILKTSDLTLSNALDERSNNAYDTIAKLQSENVKMESRASVHELEGFSQVLSISVIEDDNSITFIGEVSELTGRVLSTITINGVDFGITDFSAKNQELVAKILAVGLGFKSWEIGESMGEYKLAAFDGLHGLLLKMTNEYIPIKALSDQTLKSRPQDGCRLPYAEELLKLASLESEQKLKLNLVNIYWTASIDTNNKSIAVDFRESEAIKRSLKNKENAYLLFVKDF